MLVLQHLVANQERVVEERVDEKRVVEERVVEERVVEERVVEKRVAQESGQVIVSNHDGIINSSTSTEIQIMDVDKNIHTYDLRRFMRSNQGTCINHIPIVTKGQKIEIGQPIADSSSSACTMQNFLPSVASSMRYCLQNAL